MTDKYKLLEEVDLNTVEGRKEFIERCETSVLTGSNVQGNDLVIMVIQNDSMTKITSFEEDEFVAVEKYDADGEVLSQKVHR